jgi:hypothetical protein
MQRRLFPVCLSGLLVASCFSPVHHYLEQPPEKKNVIDTVHRADSVRRSDSMRARDKVSDAVPQKTAVQDTEALQAAPESIDIESWPGKWFVALEKPSIYCNYGYDLYTCPRVDSCRGPVDSSLISKYHRARCDRFAGSRLKAVAVTPGGNEWVVSFEEEKTGMKLYAKTTRGVFGEIALESDLDGAKKRWLGKTVFSARGFITSFEKGKTVTIKVRLQDSLKVVGVRFGLAPLPTKPIWIMVETPKGENGSIPVWYSWTNVKKELRRQGNPWDDDIFERNPEHTFRIDAATWEIINSHTVRVGMSRAEIRLSWGAPLSVKTAMLDGKEQECWVYQAQQLCFDAHECIAIKDNQQNP